MYVNAVASADDEKKTAMSASSAIADATTRDEGMSDLQEAVKQFAPRNAAIGRNGCDAILVTKINFQETFLIFKFFFKVRHGCHHAAFFCFIVSAHFSVGMPIEKGNLTISSEGRRYCSRFLNAFAMSENYLLKYDLQTCVTGYPTLVRGTSECTIAVVE